jgi:hypothetical protein
MAEKLETFPERQNIGRPVGSKYDKYLDGSVWRLVAGEDFQGDAAKFVRAIRQHANSRRGLGLKALIGDDGKTVIVQSRPKV